jgi:hypothetical protein
MKYCSKCGKETPDYTGMCQKCGSLLFQGSELTKEQKKKQRFTDDLLFSIESFFVGVTLIVLFVFFSRFIFNISEKYKYFHISLMTAFIIFSMFFFLLYFMTHKVKRSFYYGMLFIFYIEIIVTSYSNHYRRHNFNVTYASAVSFILAIASYFFVKYNFSKKDIINYHFYGVIGSLGIMALWDVFHQLFAEHPHVNKYFFPYIVISAILNILLIVIIIKYLRRKKEGEVDNYIILTTLIFIIQIIMIFLVVHNKIWTYTMGYVSTIAYYLLNYIILNAGIFYSINKSRKIINLKKLETVAVLFYFLFIILLRNYDNLHLKNVLKYFSFISFFSTIIINVVCHYIFKKIDENNRKG